MKMPNGLTVAILLSCDSFESFFGRVMQFDRDKYLSSYRNDFAWYYANGLIANDVQAIIYIPSLQYDGIYETEAGVSVRFVRCADWYKGISPFRRAMRATRWSLYVQERLNAEAMLKSLNQSMQDDGVNLLYIQEYWGGRYDHLVHRTSVSICAADHGGVAKGTVKWFKRRSFDQAGVLYCQSQDECSQVKLYGGRTVFQPNGVDTSYFRPPPPGTQRIKKVLSVARLTDKQKRTSDLIRALAELSDDWTLDIIGNGPDREALEALAKKLGVDERVSFLGFKSQADVRLAMQSCGVYAMPSAHEAMCLAVLEAMSCGAAVVASRIRTFESLLSDNVNGKLFKVGDVAGLAGAIEEAWQARARLGAAAATSVAEGFDSRTLYRKLAESMRAMMWSPVSKETDDSLIRVGG